jgi:hypothetical protein
VPDAFRPWLVKRIEREAQAFATSDSTVREIRWGRVLAYLEVGVRLGYWTKRRAEQVSESIYHRYLIPRVARQLERT